MGWLRRNRWGLLGLVPAIGALLALSAQTVSFYDSQHETRTIAADPDGYYTISDKARLRLVSLTRVTDVKDHQGRPYELPSYVVLWKATIAFQVKPDSLIGGCKVQLEDSRGRLFDDDPYNLVPEADADSPGCLDVSSPGVENPSYTSDVLFGLPPDAQPVAVRVHTETSLPRYVRMTR